MKGLSKVAVALLWIPALLTAQATESPLARLRVEGKKVGWDGVELGMSVVQAERRVGAALALNRSSSGRCQGYSVDVDHQAVRLSLGFPSNKPSAKIEWIYVRFGGYQTLAKRPELVAELKRIAPGATYVAPSAHPDLEEDQAADPTYSLPGEAGYAVRIEPGAGLLVARRECLG